MIKLLLLAVIPFMTEHRNVAPKTEVSTNFYGSVTGIVDKAYVEGLGIEPVDTQAVIKAANDYTDSATGAIRRVDGNAKMLPKYLWSKDFYDSYTNDAAWYYAQPQDYGHCSAMRDGDFLYRNLDWKFNDAADVIVRMFAGEGRFASIGVANCSTNLTEEIITSGKPSRYYKCLPGRTVDGINENGVCVEVNVVDGDVDYWDNPNGDIHPLGAVRWVLDHATNALHAAMELSMRIKFPEGWTQNFHWMIADKDATYIVEDGAYYPVTGKAVMTNFRLYPAPIFGPGWERYKLLSTNATANIKDVWFTRAYSPDTDWISEFADSEEMNAAKIAWDNGKGKESHRGEHIGNKWWWQSVHTSIYNLTDLTLNISVQETDDWYVFQMPNVGGVKVESDPTVPAWAKQPNPPQGMPSTGLVWNATANAIKTANGTKTIGAADVGALPSSYTPPNYETVSNRAMHSVRQMDGDINILGGSGSTRDANRSGQVTIGYIAKTGANGAIAIGQNTFATNSASIALGIGARSHGARTFNVPHDIGNWYAGDTPVVEAIRSRFVMTNIEEVVTNDTQHTIVTNIYTVYVPDGTGVHVAYDDKSSLARMMTDAATNHTDECECISTNICKLIKPELNRTVNANLNTYIDGETGVEYVGKFYDGSFYYVPTGNVFPPND